MRTLALLLLSTVSAAALSLPETAGKDAQVRTVAYDPMDRVKMVLTLGRVSVVRFNEMEVVKRAIFGSEDGPVTSLKRDQADQQPLINNLPLFGNTLGKTNLVVITSSPDGREHSYMFWLEVRKGPSDGSDDPEATYGLQFTYAVQEKAAAAVVAKQTWKEKQDAKMKEVAEARLNTDVFFGGIQNWSYMAQSQFHDIVPVEAHDNGRITAFRYPGNMRIPSVFIVSNGPQRIADICTTGKPSKEDSLGDEQVPQVTQMDDMVIVQQTAPHMRLRLGEHEVAEVYNCAWDKIGVNPGTGTGTGEVVRRVVSTK
jgi:type IV secretion system protein VirB9